jgi:Rrf2 family protein
MILSRSADYALRALIYLAQTGSARPVPLDQIAQAQKIPAALLSKILQMLVKAELLRSHRGYGGGFVLVADPRTLGIDVVIQAIDGPFTVVECLDDEGFCQLCSRCRLRAKLRDLQTAIVDMLHATSLADCCDEGAEGLRRLLPAAGALTSG